MSVYVTSHHVRVSMRRAGLIGSSVQSGTLACRKPLPDQTLSGDLCTPHKRAVSSLSTGMYTLPLSDRYSLLRCDLRDGIAWGVDEVSFPTLREDRTL